VKIINTVATGVVGFQKVMLLTNLFDDPGFETGTAPTDIGTPATSAQSAVQAHTGTNSWNIVTDAAGEGFSRTVVTTSGKYYFIAGWVYDATAGGTITMTATNAILQASAAANTRTTTTVGAWTRLFGVFRATAATIVIGFTATNAVTFYVDDVSAITMDDVSLTCTPASAANSVESSGIRVDGLDLCSQPIPANRLFPAFGWSRFDWIPRHAIADMDNFGFTTPMIALWRGDANNYIWIELSAANTIRLGYVSGGGAPVTGTWAAAGAFVAGTNYQLEIMWTPGATNLIVDGIIRIAIASGPNFPVVPVTFYAGSNNTPTYHVDAVFLAP
jgi:hypothetical protein